MDDPDFAAFVERIPLALSHGFELRARGADEVVLAAPARPEVLQVEGVVHGGFLATLADTAAVFLLHPRLPPHRAMTSIEFKLNFVRPARAGTELIARARPVKIGRTVALCDVDVSQGDALVAKGLFTYLFLDRPAAD